MVSPGLPAPEVGHDRTPRGLHDGSDDDLQRVCGPSGGLLHVAAVVNAEGLAVGTKHSERKTLAFLRTHFLLKNNVSLV